MLCLIELNRRNKFYLLTSRYAHVIIAIIHFSSRKKPSRLGISTKVEFYLYLSSHFINIAASTPISRWFEVTVEAQIGAAKPPDKTVSHWFRNRQAID